MRKRVNLVVDKKDSEYQFFKTDNISRKLDWRKKKHIGKVDSFIDVRLFTIDNTGSDLPEITCSQEKMVRVYYSDRRNKYIFGVTDKDK